MYFSPVRKVRKGQKEEGIPLLNFFRIKETAGVHEVCTLTEEKACSLPYIGIAPSKVEQTTRAFEPALLPLPAVGRFT